MSSARISHQWPTREEWAKARHAFYYDRFEDLGLDSRLSSYGSTAEIETLMEALKTRWKAEGVRLKAAIRAAGPLHKQPAECGSVYLQRFFCDV
jgi:hypothetical protein